VIDDHVHPFPLAFAPFDTGELGLDVDSAPGAAARRRALAPGRLHVHLLETKLAAFLDLPPEDLAAGRDELARRGWTDYLRRLFDDAELAGMIVDEALHPDDPAHPASAYTAAAGRPVWKMARLDPLVDRLVGEGATAAETVDRVRQFLAAAAAGGAVAVKTVLAYRTGLAVQPDVDLATAQRSLQDDAPVRRRGKALRDLVFRTALGTAADLGLPVQVHTGFGDSEIRLAESDPLLLDEVLRTPEGSAATVVLIHGSFPWHEQAAYLATARPNLWVELSLSNLFAPLHTADRLLRILDVAPRGRLLLGSDGHVLPETQWFACRVLADAWTRVASTLAEAGARPGWVSDTRAALFDGNARTVYRLG
jgi:predicted TIM-barrel fold metal-dependent hydrolase